MNRFLKIKACGHYELVSEIKGITSLALTTISRNMDLEDEYYILFNGERETFSKANVIATWLRGAVNSKQIIYGDVIVVKKLNRNGIKKAELGGLIDKDIKELQLLIEEDKNLAAKVVSEMIQLKGV